MLRNLLLYGSLTGAFLIPYVLFVVLGSLPVFFLEVTVGQYTRCGAMKAWKIVPVVKGMYQMLLSVPLRTNALCSCYRSLVWHIDGGTLENELTHNLLNSRITHG